MAKSLTPEGKRKGTWIRAHWEWMRKTELPEGAARKSLDYYISEVSHIEAQKKAVEKRIARDTPRPRWSGRVEALCCMKGIETMGAFALVAEAAVFSRFDSARSFASWLGLVQRRRHLACDLRKRPAVANVATARELAGWV